METPHTLSNIFNLMKFPKNVYLFCSIFEKKKMQILMLLKITKKLFLLTLIRHFFYKTEFQSSKICMFIQYKWKLKIDWFSHLIGRYNHMYIVHNLYNIDFQDYCRIFHTNELHTEPSWPIIIRSRKSKGR